MSSKSVIKVLSTLAPSMLCDSMSTSVTSDRSRFGAKIRPRLDGPILFSSLCSVTSRRNCASRHGRRNVRDAGLPPGPPPTVPSTDLDKVDEDRVVLAREKVHQLRQAFAPRNIDINRWVRHSVGVGHDASGTERAGAPTPGCSGRLTVGCHEAVVQLKRQQRLRHLAKEELEQGGRRVRARALGLQVGVLACQVRTETRARWVSVARPTLSTGAAFARTAVVEVLDRRHLQVRRAETKDAFGAERICSVPRSHAVSPGRQPNGPLPSLPSALASTTARTCPANVLDASVDRQRDPFHQQARGKVLQRAPKDTLLLRPKPLRQIL